MLKRYLSIVAVFSIATVACYAQTSAPYISSISPASVPAGTKSFAIVVMGSGFTQNSVIRWNGADQATNFVSSTQLTFNVPATYVATPGTATISVYTSQPSPSLTAISVTPGQVSISAGSTQQLQASGKYSDGSTRDLTTQVSWSSATPSAVTVTAAGLATGVSGGSAVVTASNGALSGSAVVSVNSNPPPSVVRSSSNYTTLFPDTAVPSVMINARVGVECGMKFTSDQSGFVQGVRFYKSAADYGSHVGSLWSSTGQLLAQATFKNETEQGWQQANFSAPVAIQANTTYVVSYHSTFYAYDGSYFNRTVDNAPLHAVVNTTSPNGVYGISNASVFPTIGAGGANFWVDVAFTPGPSNGSLTSITLTPANATLAAGATQQFQAIGTYSDSSTRDITSQVSWTSDTTPVATISNAGMANAVSAGSTQITASLGSVTSTTGQHVASLWSRTGQLLAQATFVNETASGWQQVNFATPVAILANTVYVVSYHSSGYYSYDPSYFSGSMVNNPPLHGMWSAVSSNGVYAYGAGSTFPNAASVGVNFWVDVLFY